MEQTKHTPEWIMDGSLIYSLMETSWHTGRSVMTNEYWFQVYARGRDEAKEIAITKQIFELITGETAAERDQLKTDYENLKSRYDQEFDMHQRTINERDQLKDLNRELLEALKYASRFLGKGVADMNYINQVIQKATKS